MNTIVHIELIKAYCLRNLEIASTFGGPIKNKPWAVDNGGHFVKDSNGHTVAISYAGKAKFIEVCSNGAAEAGWKATIAAIEHMEARNFRYMDELADEILAAYPLTLIQP